MRNIWKLLAVFAVAGGFAACNKDKGPDGPTDFSGGCEAVNLGLSVKWASYNVGAETVEGLGAYFAWGETQAKTNYDWSNEGDYKWGVYDSSAEPKFGMTKYTADVEGGDGLKTLLPKDDAATVSWGTKWRTPTKEEFDELLDETRCEWTWIPEKNGYIIKGIQTGKTIFLPIAGFRYKKELYNATNSGSYWSSTLNNSVLDKSSAYEFGFNSVTTNWIRSNRSGGRSVRAVTDY